MYTVWISLILVGMIGFGAGQTVAARALLQSAFEYPLFLSLLYHAGQSLSLITYVVIPKSWQQATKKLVIFAIMGTKIEGLSHFVIYS